MRRPTLARGALALLAASSLGFAACSTDTTTESSGGTTAGSVADDVVVGGTVTAKGLVFTPARIEIAPGQAVEFVNEDNSLHQPTSGTPDEPTDVFALDVESGESATTGPLEEGTYQYFCDVHNEMTGEIVVTPNPQPVDDQAAGHSEGTAATAEAPISGAASLRTTLNLVLAEHTILAANATGAALDGRTDDFEAAAAELAANGQDLTDAVVSIYGPDAAVFGDGWERHIGFFVDYTNAAAAGDQAGMDAARADLEGYAADLAAFLAGANPNLPEDTVTELVTGHITSLLPVIDAQAAGDQAAAYTELAAATAHMGMIADPLAGAIAGQFPEEFPGDAASGAADLQVALNTLLAHHVAWAAMATDAALDGRQAEFEAAAGLLAANGEAITEAVVSIYGPDAAVFGDGWERHIGFFVDYTNAAAAGDQAGMDAARADLEGYAADLAAFLAGANPNLPEDAATELIAGHVTTLLPVIDAQAADDPVTAFGELRSAMAHMQMLADPLGAAIVAQFPEQFAS